MQGYNSSSQPINDKINYLFAKPDVTRINTFQLLLTSINNETRQLQAAMPRSVSLKIKSGMVANWGKITFTSQYLIKTSCVWPVTSGNTQDFVQLLMSYTVELLVSCIKSKKSQVFWWEKPQKITKDSYYVMDHGPWTQHYFFFSRTKKTEAQIRYSKANREIAQSIRKDWRNFADDLARQEEEGAGKGDVKELYSITRTLAGVRKITNWKRRGAHRSRKAEKVGRTL